MTAAITLSCGLHGAEQFLRYIGILQGHSTTKIENKIPDSPQDFSALESKLKYKIRNQTALHQAFTHASYFVGMKTETFWEREKRTDICSESYQRLQYIGDGVIDFLVCKFLFMRYPHADPCMLHKLKICCLNNQLFCVIAIDLGLDLCLRSANSYLDNSLFSYKETLERLRMEAEESKTTLNLDDLDHCFVKVLSDVLEALVGVVALDTEDYDKVEEIFLPIFEPYFNVYATPLTFKEHPKCFLFELVAKEKGILKKIKYVKKEKQNNKGDYMMNHKGYIGEILIAEEEFQFDNCITEKKFFKKFYDNANNIVQEFHKSNFITLDIYFYRRSCWIW